MLADSGKRSLDPSGRFCKDYNLVFFLPSKRNVPLSSKAFEPNYRWHEDYKLSKDPLTRNSAETVGSLVFAIL